MAIVVVVVVATVGLASAGFVATDTVFTIGLPSTILFAAVSFLLGRKHGAYRTGR